MVDTSLKMSIGKTAAQCAHAAVGLVKNMHANSVPWLHAWEVRSLLVSWCMMCWQYDKSCDRETRVTGS